MQCKPGFAGNGFVCDTDEDMDGIPDEALNCTGDPRCAKVKLQRKYKTYILFRLFAPSKRLSTLIGQ